MVTIMPKQQVLLIEPFFTGSHAEWAKAYAMHSTHNVTVLSLGGQHWKWRMHGGAVTLAKQFMANKKYHTTDIIIASDMLDLSTFLALTRSKTHHAKTVTYFHENQLTYPWSPNDADVSLKRDNHYQFINYKNALCSDGIAFNSSYHKKSFLQALPQFLQQFPDYKNLDTLKEIEAKTKVLYLGLELKRFNEYKINGTNNKAVLLWNHRWEYDKNPTDFFDALFWLNDQGVDFDLLLLGESFSKQPAVFERAKKRLSTKIKQYGYAPSFKQYAQYLWQADILPVTANQDFFGGSVVQAMYCNTYPILPKRLAYPEHIPKQFQQYHYYSTEKQLHKLLGYCVKNVAEIRKTKVQKYVQHYDWAYMAPIYDKYLADFF